MKKILLSTLLLIGFATMVSAAQIAAEPFDGTAGDDVVTSTGGTGWAGPWNTSEGVAGSFTFVSPGMTFGDLPTTGLKTVFDPGSATTRINRTMATTVTVDAANTEAWACALIEIGSGAGDVNAGRAIGVELTNAGTAVVGFGKKINSSFGLGTSMNDNWVNSTVPANSVGIRFLVVKLAFDGTDTIATLYVTTDGDTIDIADPTTFTATQTITIAGALTFDGVNAYAYHGGTTSNGIDEIHIADSYETLFSTDTAHSPTPKSGATLVPVDQVLEWMAPDAITAEKYDVYFGTDPNAATMPKVQTGTTALTYTPALALGVTYHWRVDAYEAGNATPYQGKVWSFTVVPQVVLIDTDPISQTVAAGETVTLSSIALNAETYKWTKDGADITAANVTGINTDTLTITNTQLADEGFYACVASNTVPSQATTASAQIMTKRLVGHWTFDNVLTDAITGVDAEIVDPNSENEIAPTVEFDTTDAIVGSGCLLLDNAVEAEGGWLQIPGTEEIYNFYPQGLTVSTWSKTPADQSGEYKNIVEKNSGDVASRMFQRVAGTQGLFRMGPAVAWTNASISDGNWHLMTTTYDPETGIAQVYQNGVAKGFSVMEPTAAGNTAPLVIGGSFSETGMGWIGSIDDVKIYNYPLSPVEVAYSYTDVTGTTICVDNEGLVYDFNNDCVVNLEDFATFAATWLNCRIVPDCIDRP
ncbi:MAG: immunoglobulin domain-containing protein [Phycisphaerae bacterium]|nr:immunoglobulin domain-containing protein [Phycisphaerae bacterium]